MRRFFLFLAATVSLSAAPLYQVGDTLAAFTLKDQHEKSYTYAAGVRLVLVAFDMAAGKGANAYLEKQPADFLARHQAIFLSNIDGMPGIARTFALPKMRKYPHRILLVEQAAQLARFPTRPEQLTVLSLDVQGAITAIRFLSPEKDLATLLPPPAQRSSP